MYKHYTHPKDSGNSVLIPIQSHKIKHNNLIVPVSKTFELNRKEKQKETCDIFKLDSNIQRCFQKI